MFLSKPKAAANQTQELDRIPCYERVENKKNRIYIWAVSATSRSSTSPKCGHFNGCSNLKMDSRNFSITNGIDR